MLYMHIKELMELLSISRTSADAARHFVRKYPDRYGPYAVVGRLTSLPAVIDALRALEWARAGAPLPPYDEDEARKAARAVLQDSRPAERQK